MESAEAPVPEPSEATGGLAARDLGLYDSGRWVWRHIDLDILPGERLALVGPSGGGKTAMLLTLAGLVPPTEGDISLDGRSLSQWSMPECRARVGYLSQQAVLGDHETVEDALRMPFAYRIRRGIGFPRGRVIDWLQRLGRDESFLDRGITTLSGGERQLAALLRILAVAPTLLLLDEPTASMDADIAARAEKLLNDWHAESPGRGWLWVSHSERQVADVADRIEAL